MSDRIPSALIRLLMMRASACSPLRVIRRALHASLSAHGPLEGVRVLDLTRVLAGPYCTMLLGDLGADVVKVEHPKGGDDTRRWGPPFRNGESAYFLGLNRNKRSVAVDFTTAEGRDLVRSLASHADVLIENFVPGKLASKGLGYDQLSAINPKLIYTSLTAYGSDGPSASYPGYDVILSAVGGLMGITGIGEGQYAKVGVAVTDVMTGLHAHGAIMAALIARGRTGEGQLIETSLLETQVATLVNAASNYLIAGQLQQPLGTAHASIVPYQGFPTADGYLIVGAGNDNQFQKLCRALDAPDLAEDERFATNALRVEHREELVSRLSSIFQSRSTQEWLDMDLQGKHGIAIGPINTIEQVFNDPQVLHRQMIQETHHPTAGAIKLTGFPVKYKQTPTTLRYPPPLLGQHSRAVCEEWAGISPSQFNRLVDSGVVVQHDIE